jgi:hypothetical protein
MIENDIISKMRQTALQRCKERINLAAKSANEIIIITPEKYNIALKLKKDRGL